MMDKVWSNGYISRERISRVQHCLSGFRDLSTEDAVILIKSLNLYDSAIRDYEINKKS